MDINYFLLMINKYDTILDHINCILDIFDTTDILTNDKIYNSEKNKIFFIERKNDILYLKELCKININKLCRHEFIVDSIDITPDKSKTISYCKFCEINDPNF
jgi:hypothetical protein